MKLGHLNFMSRKKIDNTNAVIGLELSGFGKKIDCYNNENLIIFKKNTEQRLITRQGICSIEKPKKKTVLPYQVKDLNIAWGKDAQIFGNKLYCECQGCKEHGKIHRRYLKSGKKHGQSATFSGDLTISIILKPIIRNAPIQLEDTRSLEKIYESINNS